MTRGGGQDAHRGYRPIAAVTGSARIAESDCPPDVCPETRRAQAGRPATRTPGALEPGTWDSAGEHRGSHAQLAAVVLGQVIAGKARLVGHPNQVQPIFEQPAGRRSGDVLDVVEDGYAAATGSAPAA